MADLFDHTPLPLWVWIVIIVICSLVVLGTIAFAIRFLVVRRRQADFVDTFGDENIPQRRVTVRRGRVVESSKYLSLTGSKFGLNAFDDNDTRGGARSKSPFEWWTNVKDRSQSRNSQLTQSYVETSSIYGAPTSPGLNRMYQRRDLNMSTSSLGSGMKDDVSIAISEEPASPPPIVRNFSRSFSRQGHHSNFSPRVQTLSRIEESSPHTSMISERQSRIASYASKRDTQTSTPSPLPASPILSAAPPFRKSQEHLGGHKKSSLSQQLANSPSSETIPRPAAAYAGARSSFGDLNDNQSVSSRQHRRNRSASSRRHSQITALPESSQSHDYWENNPQQHSKKPNLLRKKSLKKSALLSQIDS